MNVSPEQYLDHLVTISSGLLASGHYTAPDIGDLSDNPFPHVIHVSKLKDDVPKVTLDAIYILDDLLEVAPDAYHLAVQQATIREALIQQAMTP